LSEVVQGNNRAPRAGIPLGRVAMLIVTMCVALSLPADPPGDPARAGVELAAAGTSSAAESVSVINVRDFGAKGDGQTDDGPALRKAIQAALAGPSRGKRIHLPAGKYRIDGNGVLSDIGAQATGPVAFTGDGWGAMELVLVTTGEPRWFYDNGTTPRLQFVTWRDIKFTGSGPSAHGFRIWSAGHEQGFRFTNCWFNNLIDAFELNGSGNDSEMYFFGCRFDSISGDVYRINNPQSVAHGFFGCDFIPLYGNLFKIGPQGGGDISVFGGSAVMRPSKGDDTTGVHYLVSIPDAAKVGPQNGNFSFFGFRAELHGGQSRLVNLPSTNGSARVSFHGCDLAATTGGTREAVIVNLSKTVLFDAATTVSPDFTFRVATPSTVRDVHQNQGEILFREAVIPDNLYDLAKLDGGAGHVRAEGCTALKSPSGARRAVDFDIGWNSTGLGQSFRMKAVLLLSTTQSFPFGGTHESTLLLPPNAVVRGVYAYKPGCGSGSTPYQLMIGSDDKTTVYLKGTAEESKELIASRDNLLINSGTAPKTRTIRLWSEGGSSPCAGGYAFVEYY